MADNPHPFLVFARPGELVVVLGDGVFQRAVTEMQLLQMSKQFMDTAIYMKAERERAEKKVPTHLFPITAGPSGFTCSNCGHRVLPGDKLYSDAPDHAPMYCRACVKAKG